MNIFDLQATISLNAANFESGIQQAQTAFNGLGAKVDAGAVALGSFIGNMATKAADNFGDFARSAVDTGMDFDTSMSNVQAISGATAEEFENLRAKAKEMGASTKFTAKEAADAFSYMAMAGWKAEDMMSGISGIMNLAAASGESLASTSDIVTDALTAFGLSAEDSGHFADVLAAASSNANTNVGMMGETFKYVAPVAGALGYSVEDMATAIGLMANSGIKGSQAGTALRSSLSRLVKPTDDVMAALGALDLLKLADDTGEFEYNMEELNKEVVAVNKAQTAYNNAVAKYGANSSQASNKAVKLAEAQQKLTSAMDAQKTAALTYNSAILDADGNMLSFADTITALRGAFAELTEAEQANYAARLFGQEAMSGMLAIINSSDADFQALSESISSASEVMDGMGAAASMAETQLGNLGGKVTLFQSAFDGLKVAIYDSFKEPMSEAIETATRAVEVMTQGFNEGGLRGALEAFGTFAKGKFEEFVASLDLSSTKVGEFLGVFDSFSGGAISSIAGEVATFMEAVDTDSSNGLMGSIVEDVRNLLEAFATGNAETIGTLAGKVKGFLDGFNNSGAVEAIATAAGSVGEFLDTFLTVSGETVESIAGGVRDFINAFDETEVGEIVGEIAEHAADLFTAFTTVGAQTIKDIAEGIETFLENVDKEKIAGAITTIAEKVGDLFGKFSDAVSEDIQSASENLGGLWETIGTDGAEIPGTLAGIAEEFAIFLGNLTEFSAGIEEKTKPIKDFFANTLGKLLVSSVKGALNFINNILSAIEHFTSAFNHNVDSIKHVFTGDWHGALNDLLNWTWDTVNGILDLFGSLVEPLIVAADDFFSAGEGLISGFWNGLKSKWDAVVQWVSEKFSGLTSLVMNIFGEHSPSKVFAGIGANLILGMEKGWESEFDGLENMIGDDMTSLTSTARVGFEDSAIGRSSAAGITSLLTANSGASSQPVEVNLVLDGEVAAKVLYDPLRNVAWQKGKAEAVYA